MLNLYKKRANGILHKKAVIPFGITVSHLGQYCTALPY